ncbi:PHD finger protein 20 [Harmonia axyridis]|uniref:PHD finger protein 20 n=1 Tax=Harmonia axyridis TaxID=115357 RepID=UPI001E279304|nr:PHD finger protein 20 [Harmonia axyridis]
MGRKCSVQGCLSDSNRVEDIGVTFHKVPMQPDVRSKWLELCRIPDEKKTIKVIYVCSRHFLRADFCNFKGKKYMLKQAVFPSVFPWDKSKLEAIKSEKQQIKAQTASNTLSEIEKLVVEKPETVSTTSTNSVNLESILQNEIKEGASSIDHIDFSIDNRINALDFNNKWRPAKIKEVDEEENEVLIHFETNGSFENNGNEYDEWVCMDSPRLKPFNSQTSEGNSSSLENLTDKISSTEDMVKDSIKEKNIVKYDVGERCLAFWSDKKKLTATVTKVMEDDNYEVIFNDGYVKCLKWNRMLKITQHFQSSPLFDPIQSTKQERRDKKRKINVAELFGIGKRQRTENSPSSPKVKATNIQVAESIPKNVDDVGNWENEQAQLERVKEESLDEDAKWFPRWVEGHPVGVESQLEFQDGTKKSVIVPDPRLPEGWAKHLFKRSGKWDTIIVSPDGKKLRSKTDIKNHLEATKLMPYDEKYFDFRICPQRRQKKPAGQVLESKKNTEVKKVTVKPPEIEPIPEPELSQEEDVNLLKIPLVDDAYKCPIEGCDKTFRKENLAQMHVKHYHPEYSKFLDTTPNVADLAYARTVGDSLDKSPIPSKSARFKHAVPKINQPNSPSVERPEAIPPAAQAPPKNKDSEIIKLLNSKPYDLKNEGEPLPPGLPLNMYPDIKLKDLLSKSEGVPKTEDTKLLTTTTKTPAGIKTLLPVRKPEVKNEEEPEATPKIKTKLGGKRKKIPSEQSDAPKPKEFKEEVPTPPLPIQVEPPKPPATSNVIMEGGEMIKIVRMKQEEIINCTCTFPEEDGLMIQCELCLCWQHAYCNNIQKESEVPEKYICFICQHPLRQRSSRKFYHDQDWLKQGVLPVGSYHSKDEELLQKRFEKLKKSHDISGGLVELQEFVNTLKVKQKIAEAKNHPKLYLWSKPWEKLPLPEKMEETQDDLMKEEIDSADKLENEEEKQLNRDLKNMIESNQPQVPMIPQPEAAIETADCKLNLLDHVLHSQNLVIERLDDFEKKLDSLEENLTQLERDNDYPRTRQTLQMVMRDLNKLEELSQNTSI